MSLVHAALGYGRNFAGLRLTETFDVYTVAEVLNESTGLMEDVETVAYADVAGQVKYPTLTVSEREQGAQVPAAQDVTIKVAVGATPNVVVNHFWRVTASTVDPGLVGREFRTKGEAQSGQTTSHRYPVERVT